MPQHLVVAFLCADPDEVFLAHVAQGLDEQFAIKNGLAHRPLFLHAPAYSWMARFHGSSSLTRLTG